MTKILAISSSPRLGGNSETLLDEFLRGLREADTKSTCEVVKFQLANLKISPCTQCDYCHLKGTCSIRDDMDQLYPRLEEADWFILASPIYFMSHCAQAKLMIDRCQVFWARCNLLNMTLRAPGRPPRRGIFISVGATHGEKVFAGVQVTMKWFFHSLEMEYWGNLLFEGLDEKGAVNNHPTALQEAYDLGQSIVGQP